MAELISNVTFQDDTPGSATAAKLNAIVTTTNQAIAEFNNLKNEFNALTKRKELVSARKSSVLDLGPIADGNPRGIPGWTTTANVGSSFDAAAGVFTAPESGRYAIDAKSLLEVDSATSPRAKLWLSRGGAEVAIDEKGIATYQNAYRSNYDIWFRDYLNQGDVITVQVQVWSNGALVGRIRADQNTMITIDRIF